MSSKAKQYVLDFSSRHVERRAMLHAALVEIHRSGRRVNALHWALLQWILNLDDGCLRKSAEEMADTLFATPSTLRRAVKTLAECQVLAVSEQVYRTSGQGPNEYRLDWDGIRAWHGRLLERQGVRIPHGQIEHPPIQIDQGASQIEHPPIQIDHAIKENTSSCIHSVFLPPPPAPHVRSSPPRQSQMGEGEVSSDSSSMAVPAPAGSQAPAWTGIEAKLRTVGLREVYATIAAAKRAQMPQKTFTDAIDFFAANRGAWGAGAFFYFIHGWSPGLAVDDPVAWPTPNDAWRKTASAEARRIVEQGRARGATDQAIRSVMARHHCLLFASELLEGAHAP